MITAVRCWGAKSVLWIVVLAANAWAASPESSDVRLHTYTVKGYLMVVSVSVNNRGPFDFLVDTGTNTTLIDPGLAKELELQPAGQMSLTSLSQSVPVTRYFLETLRAGPASVSSLEVLAAPLPQLRALGGNIRGILGMNFLLEFSFLLDYEHRRLELYPIPAQARVPEGIRAHAEINDWRILIPVASTAARQGTWRLALDSGISQLLVFQARMAPGGRGIAGCQGTGCLMQVATNLAQQKADTVRVRDMTIADVHLQDMPAVVLHNDLLNSSDPSDGLLPAAMFRSVFFDRTNGTVVFSPARAILAGR
jgi:predicted aspartyl protease